MQQRRTFAGASPPRAAKQAVALLLAGAPAIALLLAAAPVAAQSTLDRPPNLSGGWIGPAGQLHFNFIHRFNQSGAPERQIINRPTFLLGWAPHERVLLGVHYATRSDLVARMPNEWELFARGLALSEARGAPLDVAVQAGWSHAAESYAAELTAARRIGPLRVIGSARALGPVEDDDDARFAFGAGASAWFTSWAVLAADVVALSDRAPHERNAWGAGVQLMIPYSPHTFSIQVTNTNTATLHGSARGGHDRRYGFEFTVPITPRRYLRTPPAPVPPPTLEPVPEPADRPQLVEALMRQLAYVPATIEIAAGTTIVWRNDDDVEHTVTAEDGSFDSGTIPPRGVWRRTFDTPGRYPFFCVPHPFMRGVVVVR